MGFLWFPLGESLTFFKMWAVDGDTSCLILMYAGKLHPLGELREVYGKFTLDGWQYQHLQHFIASHLRGIRVAKSLTGFKSLWLKLPVDTGLLSISYKL